MGIIGCGQRAFLPRGIPSCRLLQLGVGSSRVPLAKRDLRCPEIAVPGSNGFLSVHRHDGWRLFDRLLVGRQGSDPIPGIRLDRTARQTVWADWIDYVRDCRRNAVGVWLGLSVQRLNLVGAVHSILGSSEAGESRCSIAFVNLISVRFRETQRRRRGRACR